MKRWKKQETKRDWCHICGTRGLFEFSEWDCHADHPSWKGATISGARICSSCVGVAENLPMRGVVNINASVISRVCNSNKKLRCSFCETPASTLAQFLITHNAEHDREKKKPVSPTRYMMLCSSCFPPKKTDNFSILMASAWSYGVALFQHCDLSAKGFDIDGYNYIFQQATFVRCYAKECVGFLENEGVKEIDCKHLQYFFLLSRLFTDHT